MTKEAVQPKRLRKPSVLKPDMWETNDCRIIRLQDMSDAHLEASIRLFLGIRMDERKYMKSLGQQDNLRDPVLQYRLNQLRKEWARRSEPKSFLSKLLKRVGI